MTEAELQEQVRLMCKQLGLFHYHPHDSRRSEAGWPDSTVINRRTGAIIFRELKNATRNLTPEQREVGYMMQAAGLDWGVWRPKDLQSRRVQSELAALAGHKVTWAAS